MVMKNHTVIMQTPHKKITLILKYKIKCRLEQRHLFLYCLVSYEWSQTLASKNANTILSNSIYIFDIIVLNPFAILNHLAVYRCFSMLSYRVRLLRWNHCIIGLICTFLASMNWTHSNHVLRKASPHRAQRLDWANMSRIWGKCRMDRRK